MQTTANQRTGIPFTDGDFRDNVLKLNRPTSVSDAVDVGGIRRISPDHLKLHAVSGGFNMVVEFSADTCLRRFRHTTPANDYVLPLLEVELRKLSSEGHDSTIVDELLDAIQATRSAEHYLGIRWKPTSLALTDAREISVTYEGTVALLDHMPRQQSGDSVAGSLKQFLGIDASVEPGALQQALAASPPVKDVFSLLSGNAPFTELIVASLWGKTRDDLVPRRILGSIRAQLHCPYHVRTEPARLRAWVTSNLDSASVEIEPVAADIAPLVDEYVIRRTGPGPSMFSYIVDVQDIRIAPTLCLAGHDLAPKVATLPDFEALAFAVSDGRQQALAVCFDCAPGCKGTIEEVRHFIGDAGYGLITDELILESLFLHKWQRGGFLRTLAFYNPVTVDMSDGSQQTAHLGGLMTLTSLEAAHIDIDANREIDHILIGGNATVTPEYLYLQDGRRIVASEVGLDETMETSWSVFTDLKINPGYSPDPHMRAFQVRAYLDAYRFVCKPFASLPSDLLVAPQYVRVDGISRRVLFLANITSPF